MGKVEVAVLRAQSELKIIPETDLKNLEKVVKDNVDLRKMKEIEKETHHDLMAFIRTVDGQTKGEYTYLHFGVTSNDINDTATALQLREFYVYLENDLKKMLVTISGLVKRYESTIMLGRTHGQHASPITFGLKLSTYLSEFVRHTQRFHESKRRILVGKALGPVGTAGSMGSVGLKVSKRAMELLGLESEIATNQLVSRDRYIEYLSILANIAVTCDKIGTEIRNLQRPEIGEVMEFFDTKKQVGSSSMPSKRNPIESENVCSLSRMIRSMVTPEMEAAVTWHERDLTNSALERFTIPYSSILTDYILVKLERILSNLWVDKEKMKKNLENSPLCISERLTSELTNRNVSRQEAHEIVRKISMEYYNNNEDLFNIIKSSSFGKLFTETQIKDIMDPEKFLGSSVEICHETIKMAEKIIEVIK